METARRVSTENRFTLTVEACDRDFQPSSQSPIALANVTTNPMKEAITKRKLKRRTDSAAIITDLLFPAWTQNELADHVGGPPTVGFATIQDTWHEAARRQGLAVSEWVKLSRACWQIGSTGGPLVAARRTFLNRETSLAMPEDNLKYLHDPLARRAGH
jgi:hypothetical protein